MKKTKKKLLEVRWRINNYKQLTGEKTSTQDREHDRLKDEARKLLEGENLYEKKIEMLINKRNKLNKETDQ